MNSSLACICGLCGLGCMGFSKASPLYNTLNTIESRSERTSIYQGWRNTVNVEGLKYEMT